MTISEAGHLQRTGTTLEPTHDCHITFTLAGGSTVLDSLHLFLSPIMTVHAS